MGNCWKVFAKLLAAFAFTILLSCGGALEADADALTPLLKKGRPVDWWFVFKFNASSFPDGGLEQSWRGILIAG